MMDGNYPAEIYDKPKIQERLDQISMFLHFIEPSAPINMLVGKEKSVGHIKEEHMEGHIEMDYAIMTFLEVGQLRTGMKMSFSFISEFKMTMSIGGEFMNNVTKQELRYAQTQHVYQHPEERPKRGGIIFGRKK